MKQFIVLLAMILLGVALYGLIAGSQEGSLLSTLRSVWSNELVLRTTFP